MGNLLNSSLQSILNGHSPHLLNIGGRDGQEVHLVSQSLAGLHGGNVGVHQHRLHPLLLHGLDGLGTCVMEGEVTVSDVLVVGVVVTVVLDVVVYVAEVIRDNDAIYNVSKNNIINSMFGAYINYTT